MLSQNEQIKACYRRHEWPLLPEPINVRVKFQKIGNLQYISHLDLQRTLHRILVRAGIPMWYTKGFNPHAKIVFSSPLSVGAESVCEMVDIRIDRDMPCETIMELLNREVTEELRVLDVYVPSRKFADLAWATYEITIHEKGIAEKLDRVQEIAASSRILTVKKTKSGEKEVDIAPQIKSFQLTLGEDGETAKIQTVLRISADNYLNPELLLSVFKQRAGLLEDSEAFYSILRKEIYLEDGATPFR